MSDRYDTTDDDYAGINARLDDALASGAHFCDLCGELCDEYDIDLVEYDCYLGSGWVCKTCQAEKLSPCPHGCGLTQVGRECSEARSHEPAPVPTYYNGQGHSVADRRRASSVPTWTMYRVVEVAR